MAAKHPHILRSTCTATALSVMLAACGGGGGSERDKAVSRGPHANSEHRRHCAHLALCHHAPEQPGRYRSGEHAERWTAQLRTAGPHRTAEPDNPSAADHACPDAAGGTGRHQAGPDAGASSGIQDGAQYLRPRCAWGCSVGDD